MPSQPIPRTERQEQAERRASEPTKAATDETSEPKPSHREWTLEETLGSVKPIGPPIDAVEACRLAKEEKVLRTLAELDE